MTFPPLFHLIAFADLDLAKCLGYQNEVTKGRLKDSAENNRGNMSYGPLGLHGFGGVPGYLLPKPVLTKSTRIDVSDMVIVASTSMQGWRSTMEDVSVVLLKIPGDHTGTMYFSVFDGHGGTRVAKYAGANLHKFIMKQREWEWDIKEAIYKGYKDCDAQMRMDKNVVNEMSGTTALTVFIRGGSLICANAGDSRAVGSVNGRVVRLSYDHKPSLPVEKNRIVAAGGFVEADRVNGNLALSRALGDFQYKLANFSPEFQMVSPIPDMILKQLDRNWEFVVLACDGIWEVMSNEMVVNFVRSRLIERIPVQHIAEALMANCLSPKCTGMSLGCDNMSVIIIQFRWNECKQRHSSFTPSRRIKTKIRKLHRRK